MKLNVASQMLTEMGKPSQVCPKCGHSPIHKTHTYNAKATSDADKWRCKNAPLPGYPLANANQQAGATPTPAATPAPTAKPQVTSMTKPAAQPAPTPVRATPAATPAPQPTTVVHTAGATKTEGPREYTKEEIRSMLEKWLADKGVHAVEIHEDNSIDVHESVLFKDLKLRKLPVKIHKVQGDFSITGGSLNTLENCPDEVTEEFEAVSLNITSFVGCPKKVGEDCSLALNKLVTSIEGLPETIGGSLDLTGCSGLKSVRGIHKIVKRVDGKIDLSRTSVEEGALSLMAIRGVTEVVLTEVKVAEIINKHLKSDDRDINAAQEELIDAGFSSWARM